MNSAVLTYVLINFSLSLIEWDSNNVGMLINYVGKEESLILKLLIYDLKIKVILYSLNLVKCLKVDCFF